MRLALLTSLLLALIGCGSGDESTAPAFILWKITGAVTSAASGTSVPGADVVIEIFPPRIPGSEEVAQATFELVTDAAGSFAASDQLTDLGPHRVHFTVTPPAATGLQGTEGERVVSAFPQSVTDTVRVEILVALTN